MFHRRRLTRRVGALLLAVLAVVMLTGCGVTRDDEGRGLHRLRMMVPNSPGGGYDLTARTAVKIMQDKDITGRVEVFNVIGAGGDERDGSLEDSSHLANCDRPRILKIL